MKSIAGVNRISVKVVIVGLRAGQSRVTSCPEDFFGSLECFRLGTYGVCPNERTAREGPCRNGRH